MSASAFLYHLISTTDRVASAAQVSLVERTPCLVTTFTHMLFADEAEARAQGLNALEAMTVGKFAGMIERFLESGYKIVTVPEIANGLHHDKSLLLTFDDGFFSNARALPVLEEFDAKATVFVSANHVRDGRAFWWNPFIHARMQQGVAAGEIERECGRLNTLRTPDIEAQIMSFAPNANFRPTGDLDRPLTMAELKDLAKTGRFHFENHTSNHAVLTAYSDEEARREILDAQALIEQWTGRRPIAIAYPNGMVDARIARVAAEAGMQIGFSTRPRKEYRAAFENELSRMTLGRFMPRGFEDIDEQCRYFRSDLMITERIQRMRRRGPGHM